MAATKKKIPTPEVELLLFEARVCEQAECYEEMFETIEKLIREKNSLATSEDPLDYSLEERVLLSSCFRGLVSANLEAVKTISATMKNPA